ncbi:putative mitochondrial hypothetical protein [Leptomonas pyrrhocoris]|uniref:Present in the outer mitochondrial membrane proteome 7 n=1 Tax=Leptomonas pyrrhocoris TaxID=157538 RepID=A0A0M9GAL1_LEPPY|nr:putative mitochondrial hypothetical protein [Leptomonas pyrrhocoris]KPA86340.1 putative mitochondrial hypothetical protein [Leptomonas pyrrhocoris]|eukprot:XP_015664779.1 putative mitochondrial hypothetical protein [Leptomonas pyrrhocoris]
MTEGTGHRKVWIAAAVSTTLLVLLLRQRRQKRKAARQNAANATRAALTAAAQRSLLPVFVRPESLPTGWGVAPPVFYPPHSAVIPLVLPSEMAEVERSSHLVRKANVATTGVEKGGEGASAFILCSHTGVVTVKSTDVDSDEASSKTSADTEARRQQQLTDLLAHHPVLKGQFSVLSTQWTSIATVFSEPEKKDTAAPATPPAAKTGDAADAVSPVFTHLLEGSENCVLLGGVNGPYFVVAVLSGFEGTFSGAAASGNADLSTVSPKAVAAATPDGGKIPTSAAAVSTDVVMDLAGVTRGIVQATLTVPLASADKGVSSSASSPFDARLPGGAAFAVHRGYYRVLCVREGRELELCVPTEVSVRSMLGNQSLTTTAETSVDAAAAQDVLLTLIVEPNPFSTQEAVEVRVTEEVFAALLEAPDAAAATLWRGSGATANAHPAAAAAFQAVTARPLAASTHVRANMVTMVYAQPQLGVLFSVSPRSSVVYEPWMTDLPTILYYPLGEDVMNDGEDHQAPPLMSIEYVLELPDTWEVQKKDSEELRHNVLFHFTNWEAAAVSSSMTELSGMRCVMFHEARDGRRCRSYILPRDSTVLIVRWETSVETWEKYLPLFQQTLDTLHIDSAAITK